ncbi:MAG TPA: hypothetical protein VGG22_06955 [Candidatus Baltobacteraceae bacterium]|jgi:hypothetical protein
MGQNLCIDRHAVATGHETTDTESGSACFGLQIWIAYRNPARLQSSRFPNRALVRDFRGNDAVLASCGL